LCIHTVSTRDLPHRPLRPSFRLLTLSRLMRASGEKRRAYAAPLGGSADIIATDKETGKVVWETSFSDTPDVTFTVVMTRLPDAYQAIPQAAGGASNR
jgi:hypothetical protein